MIEKEAKDRNLLASPKLSPKTGCLDSLIVDVRKNMTPTLVKEAQPIMPKRKKACSISNHPTVQKPVTNIFNNMVISSRKKNHSKKSFSAKKNMKVRGAKSRGSLAVVDDDESSEDDFEA